jgi:uncharacterized membrane protein HdeD (DUF308 family)
MDAARTAEVRGFLAGLGRAWGWIVAYGVVSVLVGFIAVVYPGATLVAIAIIFAIQLLVAAIYQLVFAFAVPAESGWLRALVALLAIVSFAVALYLLGHVGITLLLLAVLLGVYWIAAGVIELLIGIEHPELHGRTWMIISGALSVLAGGVVVLFPGTSLVFLTYVLGFWLILFGIGLIIRGFTLRSLARTTAPRAAT